MMPDDFLLAILILDSTMCVPHSALSQSQTISQTGENDMSIQNPNSLRLRLPATALVASFVGWLVVVVSAAALVFPTYPHGLGPLTPQQMQTSPGVYLFFQLIFLLPVLLGVVGIFTLFNPLKETKSRTVAWLMLACTIVAIALVLVLVALRLSLVGFTDATLGENSLWKSTSWAFDHLVGPAMAIATLMTGIALFISGTLRRTGLVVAILSAALGIMAIFGAILPPAVLGLMWLALGIGLLRRKDALIAVGGSALVSS
jgi:hypothetical protein